MPCGNETGPSGTGPMTGKAAGYCAGFSAPGYTNPVGGPGYFGCGRGLRGRGGGRGRRNRFFATGLPGRARTGYGFCGPAVPAPTAEQQLDALKQQAEFLQNNLSQVNERIEQLEKESKK